MVSFFLKNYSAFLWSGIILISLAILLFVSETNYTIVDATLVSKPIAIFVNFLMFFVCWLVLATLLSKFSVLKVIGIISLLFLSILAEHFLQIHQNPVTIPLIILFWLGVTHLSVPNFFKKYRLLIFGVYGLVILYFLFMYVSTTHFSVQNRESFAHHMLIPVPFFVLLWSYEQWRSYQLLKTEKAKTELSLLKSQIHPHFFFNTLHNLYGLTVEKSDKAPEVVLKLSDMMRYTIYEGKKAYVSLQEEIAYLNNYIALHKLRYQKNVSITFWHDVNQQLQVTPLLFIILLENAFKHGVETLRTDAFISMEMTTKNKQLIFMIRNNFDENERTVSEGIGLENLKQRLQHSYPKKHQLTTQKNNGEFCATLQLDLT